MTPTWLVGWHWTNPQGGGIRLTLNDPPQAFIDYLNHLMLEDLTFNVDDFPETIQGWLVVQIQELDDVLYDIYLTP